MQGSSGQLQYCASLKLNPTSGAVIIAVVVVAAAVEEAAVVVVLNGSTGDGA